MVYGIIDLGSNTIRLSIFKYDGTKIKLLTNKKVIVGLAACTENGILTEEGISKTCKVLNKYKIILQNSPAKAFSLFATASLRNIKNRAEVAEQIRLRTGMEPEIIQGEEEAMLGFVAVKHNYAVEDGVVADIGGGSTELVVFENRQIKHLTSIPIGSLNLQNKNVKDIAATAKEILKMRKIICKALDDLGWEPKKYSQLYAIGGTARAVLEVSKELYEVPGDSKCFCGESLKHIMKRLKSNDCREYKAVYKVVPERIFSFCGGVVILHEIVKRFGIELVNVSKSGIRDGYFIDRVIRPLAGAEDGPAEKPSEDFIEDCNTSEMGQDIIGDEHGK